MGFSPDFWLRAYAAFFSKAVAFPPCSLNSCVLEIQEVILGQLEESILASKSEVVGGGRTTTVNIYAGFVVV